MKDQYCLVIDSGLANLGSLIAAIRRCEYDPVVCGIPPRSEFNFSHLILPGVGSFRSGMERLEKSGWADFIRTRYHENKLVPTLGICLGMQLFASRGYEGDSTSKGFVGLNLIPGVVTELTDESGNARPHIGWNSVMVNPDAKATDIAIRDQGDYYFVNSYAFQDVPDQFVFATTDIWGRKAPTVVRRNNLIGVQFHPEKSQLLGLDMLKSFLALPREPGY